MELRTALLRLDYDVPMEMFTLAWTRDQTDRVHRYFRWRMASHRRPGHPAVEPEYLKPFKIPRPAPRRRGVMQECWSLEEWRRE